MPVKKKERPKIALTIAGSDPSGGAGIQGDLRTFAAFGVHALSAITCLTVQGTRGVREVVPVDPAVVRAQIETVLADVRIEVVKTGALCTRGAVRAVLDLMGARRRLPLVVDPVIASSSGAALLDRSAMRLLRDELLPLATLVTPNVDELAMLLDIEAPHDVDTLIEAARMLHARTGRAVLAKGGHLRGAPTDVLIDDRGVELLVGRRIKTRCTHGTGCTLASAIAAELARGASLRIAVRSAKTFVEAAMRAAVPIGPGHSPLDHLHAYGNALRRASRSPSPRR